MDADQIVRTDLQVGLKTLLACLAGFYGYLVVLASYLCLKTCLTSFPCHDGILQLQNNVQEK